MSNRQQVQRLHARYPLSNPGIAWISRDGIKVGHLLELGFGGCAAELNSQNQNPLFLTTTGPEGSPNEWLTLHYLNTSYKMRIAKHVTSGTRIGVEFYFEDTQAFEFIRSIVYPLRCGAATRYMQLNGITSIDDLPVEFVSGGEIPFKLTMDGADGREVPFVNLSIRKNLVLHQFVREVAGIRTMHSIWPGAISGDLRDTEPMDQNILRAAFGFFWSYSGGDRSNAFCEIALEIMRTLNAPITLKR